MMPHLAEEMYSRLHPGHGGVVADLPWLEADAALAAADTVTIAVQVSGKLRGTIVVPPNQAQEANVALALAHVNVVPLLDGKAVRKTIYVPDRIVNFVISG